MSLTSSTITINFLQQPPNGASFSYRISNNGVPITYTSGVQNVYKQYKSSQQSLSKCIVGLDNDFNVEPSFTFGTGFNSDVFTIATQSGGKILVGGAFTSYNGSAVSRLCRLNADGTLDTTFTNTGFNSTVRKIIVNPLITNSIYVLGDFTNIVQSGKSYSRLIKLNSDGTINTTFTPVVFNNSLNDMLLHSNGTLYIIGSFTNVSGATRNRIVNISSSGAVNVSVTFGTGFNNVNYQPACIAEQSTGKIIVGGDFANFSGNTVGNIVRITTAGAYDNTLTQGTGFAGGGGVYSVRALYIDSSDNIYATGRFNTYNGVASRGLIRLTSAGVRDAAFNVGTGFLANDQGYSITKNSDGRIVVGGTIESYNGTSVSKLITIRTDGVLHFTPTTSYNAGIRCVIVDGTKVIAGGSFTVFNNTAVTNTQFLVPIGTSLTASQANTYNNLTTFNIHTDVTYTSATGSIYVEYEHDDADVIIVDTVSDIPGYVEIVLPSTLSIPANFILTNSPYLNIASFTYSFDTVETKMKIWKGDYIADLPVDFQEEFTKQITYTGQNVIYFNVSNYLREYNNTDIDNYMLVGTASIDPLSEDTSTWAQITTNVFYNGSTQSSETKKYLSIDGLGWTEDGLNPVPPNVFITSDQVDILRTGQSRVHFVTNDLLDILVDGVTMSYTAPDTFKSNEYVMSHLIQDNGLAFTIIDFVYSSETITKKFWYVDECLYNPIELIFKNKYGLLQTIPFSKKSSEEFSVESKDFERSIITQQGTYNARKHSKVTYMLNGQRSVTLNTTYVKEYFNDTYKELLHSEEIYMNDGSLIYPVVLSNKDWTPLTWLDNKLIQYTLKVDIASPTINRFI